MSTVRNVALFGAPMAGLRDRIHFLDRELAGLDGAEDLGQAVDADPGSR
jgi:hypothetical protein